MMPRGWEPCHGTGSTPAKDSKEFKVVGHMIYATHGKCRTCGKRCALTEYGYIHAHRDARETSDDSARVHPE